eukprot:CAMPEP_0185155626 /NCGR_PEP_ID=MMETSP1139-20130426/568_1 /TAXON_ID=298111 /ORGANISM="Pavlova sp., Strain CCMP459" /LENGTH=223 /DNA_ID=CAMNT_0027720539 /DNA_START=291 /DNA_END=963 /DNA_ORIENTATION=-
MSMVVLGSGPGTGTVTGLEKEGRGGRPAAAVAYGDVIVPRNERAQAPRCVAEGLHALVPRAPILHSSGGEGRESLVCARPSMQVEPGKGGEALQAHGEAHVLAVPRHHARGLREDGLALDAHAWSVQARFPHDIPRDAWIHALARVAQAALHAAARALAHLHVRGHQDCIVHGSGVAGHVRVARPAAALAAPLAPMAHLFNVGRDERGEAQSWHWRGAADSCG